MKQEASSTTTAKAESRCTKLVSQSTTPSRLRTSSKTKDSPKPENASGLSSPSTKATRPKSVPGNIHNNNNNNNNRTPQKAKRSLVLNKLKSEEDVDGLGSQKGRDSDDVKAFRPLKNRPVVERFAKLVPPGMCDPVSLKKKELLETLEQNETVIRSLQSELVQLKAELDKSQSLNKELQSQNDKLSQDLAAAEAKIALLTDCNQENFIAECEVSNFKDLQKLMAKKIELPKAKKDAISESSTTISQSTAVVSPSNNKSDMQKMIPDCPSASPAPPPLPPRLPPRSTTTRKPSVVVQLYQSLSKHDRNTQYPVIASYNKPSVSIAHNNIVGEIQNRSAHLLAVKSDIESKGEFINGLIQKVLAATYADIKDVVRFVDWLDGELSSLSDEQAVLKHFKWPEKKADAMREAAIEYGSLKVLESELSSYKVDADIPCAIALKKMSPLLDKSEKSIHRLIKLRNSVMISYQGLRIPTDWMLDAGIISKIKQASAMLANMYVKRIMEELGSIRCSEKESTQEALLLQGVHFAYRAHKIAGSLDSETLCAFEEIRQRLPGHVRGSQELLAGIPSQ